MARQVINPGGLYDSEQFKYGQGIVDSGTCYVSRQVALDAEVEVPVEEHR